MPASARRRAAALALLSLPFNAGLALKLLYKTVDAMWYAAGDTSTDFNFYTKRATLAGVYSSTLLYWLNDRSPGSEATWASCDRGHRRRDEDREANPGEVGGPAGRLGRFQKVT